MPVQKLPDVPTTSWETARSVIRRNFQRISSILFGPNASPIFGGLTVKGSIVTETIQISGLADSVDGQMLMALGNSDMKWDFPYHLDSGFSDTSYSGDGLDGGSSSTASWNETIDGGNASF